MNVLLGICPRLLSIVCNNDLDRVIPSFSVLSPLVVLTILILYIKTLLAIRVSLLIVLIFRILIIVLVHLNRKYSLQ